MSRHIYPLTLANCPLSYHIRGQAVNTFVSSLEYPLPEGIMSAIQADLDGVAEPVDYELLKFATEEIINPIGDTFESRPMQRIDYGPSPADVMFHMWAHLTDNKFIQVQYQMNPARVMSAVLPPPVIGAPDINRDTSDLDTVQDYEYGDELDQDQDMVPQDMSPTGYRPLDPSQDPTVAEPTPSVSRPFGRFIF